MTDRIFLHGMAFECRVGVGDEERAEPQVIELDVELRVDLGTAGRTDDLAQTVDYGAVFEICRAVVEERSFRLLEAIAEQVASEVLARHASVESVLVTVRKPGVPLDGVLDFAGVGVERHRTSA